MRLAPTLLVVALGGCGGSRAPMRTTLVDTATADESDAAGRLVRELDAEVRASYERPTIDAAAAAAVIDGSVGLTVFGVGPDDVDLGVAPDTRWPVVEVVGEPARVVSRRRELFLSADRKVGWSFDEVSLHLAVCGHTASIPLRVAQVHVRDSERWTLVAEHVAYAQPMGRWLDTAVGVDGVRIATAVERQLESAQAREALVEAISVGGDRSLWDGSVGGLAVWPDPLHVLRHGGGRYGPSLAETLGASSVTVEGLRLALGRGRDVAVASATLLAAVPRPRANGNDDVTVRLRATFVLERSGRAGWRVRFAMVSTPITTGALVGRTLGVVASLGTGGRVTTSCR